MTSHQHRITTTTNHKNIDFDLSLPPPTRIQHDTSSLITFNTHHHRYNIESTSLNMHQHLHLMSPSRHVNMHRLTHPTQLHHLKALMDRLLLDCHTTSTPPHCFGRIRTDDLDVGSGLGDSSAFETPRTIMETGTGCSSRLQGPFARLEVHGSGHTSLPLTHPFPHPRTRSSRSWSLS
jgi:hypothetical protein